MSLWSANSTVKMPLYLNRTDKRNVIMTDIGYVRRLNKGTRKIDETLISIYGLATNSGAPKIHDVYFDVTSANVGQARTVNVVFTHPLKFEAGSGNIKLTVSNTKPGAAAPTVIATCAGANTSISGANNTLSFTFTPTETGTFTVLGQTASNVNATAINLRGNTTANTAANLQIATNVAGAVTNLVI